MKKKPAAAGATPPPELSQGAAQVWKQYVSRFTLEPMDFPIFEIFCESFAAWRNLISTAAETGPVVRVNGQPVPNPNLTRADREAEKVRRLVIGFTKAANTKRMMGGEDL